MKKLLVPFVTFFAVWTGLWIVFADTTGGSSRRERDTLQTVLTRGSAATVTTPVVIGGSNIALYGDTTIRSNLTVFGEFGFNLDPDVVTGISTAGADTNCLLLATMCAVRDAVAAGGDNLGNHDVQSNLFTSTGSAYTIGGVGQIQRANLDGVGNGNLNILNNTTNGMVIVQSFDGDVQVIASGSGDEILIQSSDGLIRIQASTNATVGVQVQGNLVPSIDGAFNLGSPTQAWDVVYANSNSVHLGTNVISTDGINLLFNGVALVPDAGTNTLAEVLTEGNTANNNLILTGSGNTIRAAIVESTNFFQCADSSTFSGIESSVTASNANPMRSDRIQQRIAQLLASYALKTDLYTSTNTIYGDVGSVFQGWDTDLDTLSAPGNWRVAYSDGSGNWQVLALGASGTVFQSEGPAAAPIFGAPSATDANAIYRNNTQPPTTDISWASNDLENVKNVDFTTASNAITAPTLLSFRAPDLTTVGDMDFKSNVTVRGDLIFPGVSGHTMTSDGAFTLTLQDSQAKAKILMQAATGLFRVDASSFLIAATGGASTVSSSGGLTITGGGSVGFGGNTLDNVGDSTAPTSVANFQTISNNLDRIPGATNSPTDGQIRKWNATDGRYYFADDGGGGGGSVTTVIAMLEIQTSTVIDMDASGDGYNDITNWVSVTQVGTTNNGPDGTIEIQTPGYYDVDVQGFSFQGGNNHDYTFRLKKINGGTTNILALFQRDMAGTDNGVASMGGKFNLSAGDRLSIEGDRTNGSGDPTFNQGQFTLHFISGGSGMAAGSLLNTNKYATDMSAMGGSLVRPYRRTYTENRTGGFSVIDGTWVRVSGIASNLTVTNYWNINMSAASVSPTTTGGQLLWASLFYQYPGATNWSEDSLQGRRFTDVGDVVVSWHEPRWFQPSATGVAHYAWFVRCDTAGGATSSWGATSIVVEGPLERFTNADNWWE